MPCPTPTVPCDATNSADLSPLPPLLSGIASFTFWHRARPSRLNRQFQEATIFPIVQSYLAKLEAIAVAIMLVPPPNYGMVEDNFYRSGQPDQLNFPFLEKLGLKSVIWLAPEEPEPGFLDFCVDQNIQLHHLGVLYSTNSWDPITEEVVLQALHLLVQPATYPVLVMCNLGRHRTGTVIGCFRKLQRWNLSAILEEYRRYAGPKVRVMNEQFIELFDEELVFG
ncbi:tyrosine-protein phosphatase required for protection against superoxide stress (By similarity) [Thecaphora frezii]